MCKTLNFFLISHWLSHSGFSFRVSYWRSLSRQWWSPLPHLMTLSQLLLALQLEFELAPLGPCWINRVGENYSFWKINQDLNDSYIFRNFSKTVCTGLYGAEKNQYNVFSPHYFISCLDSKLFVSKLGLYQGKQSKLTLIWMAIKKCIAMRLGVIYDSQATNRQSWAPIIGKWLDESTMSVSALIFFTDHSTMSFPAHLF